MTNKLEINMNSYSLFYRTAGWIFGTVVFCVGLLNSFWGNDLGFGLFLILLSFVYFPPVNHIIKDCLGVNIPFIAKILLGIFIIIATLGVGELFYKIDLMMMDL